MMITTFQESDRNQQATLMMAPKNPSKPKTTTDQQRAVIDTKQPPATNQPVRKTDPSNTPFESEEEE